MNSEQMHKMIREAGERLARSYDRELLSACTYAVDPGREEPKTATAVLAQMESVTEQMRRYQAEAARRLALVPNYQWSREVLENPFIQSPPMKFNKIPRPAPAPLTFTALQETVLPDLYGKKQHAQLLAAAKKREADAAARLREKIGGLLRGFLGARREED